MDNNVSKFQLTKYRPETDVQTGTIMCYPVAISTLGNEVLITFKDFLNNSMLLVAAQQEKFKNTDFARPDLFGTFEISSGAGKVSIKCAVPFVDTEARIFMPMPTTEKLHAAAYDLDLTDGHVVVAARILISGNAIVVLEPKPGNEGFMTLELPATFIEVSRWDPKMEICPRKYRMHFISGPPLLMPYFTLA